METTVRVAIAEDQEIVRKGIIEIILAFGGYSLDIEACNGKELIDKLTKAAVLPDIVVLDISMPTFDGYETIDVIRKKWPELKVLVLTMHKHEFAIIKMFRSGANGYLLKNSSPKVLQEALVSILETGLYFSEVASGKLYHRLQHSNIIPSLSEKEVQLLKLCHTDLTYKEIADKMSITERSVAGYRSSLFEKLCVNSRAGLVVCAIQMGLVMN
jgi:two-component system, NarL family, invasion response regulator UvrY